MSKLNVELVAAIEDMPLVDHHTHSVLKGPTTEAQFLDAITEADHPIDRQATFDTQVGFAIRRYCAPVLGLTPFATANDYVARRLHLGSETATQLLMTDARIGTYLLDGGYNPDALYSPGDLMNLAGGARYENIVRLETTAESVMAKSRSGADFLARLYPSLEEAGASAVGWKTVAAYRTGLDLDPARPSAAEVLNAANDWWETGQPGAASRLTNRTIIRNLIWWAMERGDVVQVHAGFGNTNLHLATANPAMMQRLVAATQSTGGRLIFLHCYPFLREAGYLAQVYPHVYIDAGLTINYLGANAGTAIRETLDLAPFTKVLFSSDAWGAAELVHLGARIWRDETARVLSGYVANNHWPTQEVIRVAEMIAWRNAENVYGRTFVSGTPVTEPM